MERVFSVEATAVPSLTARSRTPSMGSLQGSVERVLGNGIFVVALEDGRKIEVRSLEALKPGSRVRVFFPEATKEGAESVPEEGPADLSRESPSQWSAFIPLGFGGKNAKAHLEVFTEKKGGSGREKTSAATYLVFTVTTQRHGEVQWSVHLRGRQVTLQVFSPEGDRTALGDLARGIETGLRNLGFVFSTPVVFLGRPFRAPAGFRLNVRG